MVLSLKYVSVLRFLIFNLFVFVIIISSKDSLTQLKILWFCVHSTLKNITKLTKTLLNFEVYWGFCSIANHFKNRWGFNWLQFKFQILFELLVLVSWHPSFSCLLHPWSVKKTVELRKEISCKIDGEKLKGKRNKGLYCKVWLGMRAFQCSSYICHFIFCIEVFFSSQFFVKDFEGNWK